MIGTVHKHRRLANRKLRLSMGILMIDRAQHEVMVGRRVVRLTPTECALLWQLALAPGRVFRRDELLAGVWQGVAVESRTVDTHLSKVSRKLREHPRAPFLIETVWGWDTA